MMIYKYIKKYILISLLFLHLFFNPIQTLQKYYLFRLFVIETVIFNPSGSKGFGAPRGGGGGEGSKRTSQYLKNEKCYKPETFGGVRSIL